MTTNNLFIIVTPFNIKYYEMVNYVEKRQFLDSSYDKVYIV